MKRLMSTATHRALFSWLWNFIDEKTFDFLFWVLCSWWYSLATQKKVHVYVFLIIERIFKLWEYGLPFQNIYISEWLTYCLLDIQVVQNCFSYVALVAFPYIGWKISTNKNNKIIVTVALVVLGYKQQKLILAV